MLRTIARRSAGAALLGGGATASYAYTDPGFGRQLTFWRAVAPAAVQYAMCSVRNKKVDAKTRSQEFGKLHDKFAPVALDVILSLRGLYVKFGQAAASSPFVPSAYRVQFGKLQSDLPSESFSLIKQVVEEDIGPIEQVFEHFSEVACGAASIGQAHVAKLRTGEEVVVKVQYPNAKCLFKADCQCLRTLVWLAQPEALPAYAEFEKQLALELDYGAELHNLSAIHDAVMPRYSHRIAVPIAHGKLCSERVLTMQYLAGPKLEDAIKRELAALGMRIDENESMRDWLVRMDPQQQQGGDAWEESGNGGRPSWWVRAVRLAGGLDCVLWLVNKAARATLDGSKQRSQDELRARVSSLVEVHGYEMFVTGLFNADPHPGNLIAMADGRVGLIDYGQCKLLEPEPRRAIADLMVKVADDAPAAEVAAAFRRVGVVTEKEGDEFLSKMARLMFGKISVEMLDRNWHKELHKSNKITHFPPELLMVHRVALILRGLSVALRHNFSVAELWRPHAAAALAAAEASTSDPSC